MTTKHVQQVYKCEREREERSAFIRLPREKTRECYSRKIKCANSHCKAIPRASREYITLISLKWLMPMLRVPSSSYLLSKYFNKIYTKDKIEITCEEWKIQYCKMRIHPSNTILHLRNLYNYYKKNYHRKL